MRVLLPLALYLGCLAVVPFSTARLSSPDGLWVVLAWHEGLAQCRYAFIVMQHSFHIHSSGIHDRRTVYAAD